MRVSRAQLRRLISEAMIGRVGAPPKRIDHDIFWDDIDAPVADGIMSKPGIDKSIKIMYDDADSLELKVQAIEFAYSMGQITDEEYEDASFDIDTAREGFQAFKRSTYWRWGYDKRETKYTGTAMTEKMKRGWKKVIARNLYKWERAVLERITYLFNARQSRYGHKNKPGWIPSIDSLVILKEVPIIARMLMPDEVVELLRDVTRKEHTYRGTPAGDIYESIKSEIESSIKKHKENMGRTLEEKGHIELEYVRYWNKTLVTPALGRGSYPLDIRR